MNRVTEHDQKVKRLTVLMQEKNLDGICLFKFMNYAWCSAGGSNRVVTGSECGCSVLIIMRDGRKYVAAPRNEIRRITTEETAGLGFEPITFPWNGNVVQAIKQQLPKVTLGTDVPKEGMQLISDDIDRLRFSLTKEEQEKVRTLADVCSFETASLCASLKPGMTEFAIGAALSARLLTQGIRPAVLLIGADNRLTYCRHTPLTSTVLKKYAIISLVGEKDGLHVTLTRSVHFGKIPQTLQKKFMAACEVDAAMCQATKEGVSISKIFELRQKKYAEMGYPEEWMEHHQGGAIGYASREFRAGEREEQVKKYQMFGWNPTVQGTKSEETIIIGEQGQSKVLTTVPAWWPLLNVKGDVRPAILEV